MLDTGVDTGELDSTFYDNPIIKARSNIASNSKTDTDQSNKPEIPVMMQSQLQLKLDATQAIPTWKRGTSSEENDLRN